MDIKHDAENRDDEQDRFLPVVRLHAGNRSSVESAERRIPNRGNWQGAGASALG